MCDFHLNSILTLPPYYTLIHFFSLLVSVCLYGKYHTSAAPSFFISLADQIIFLLLNFSCVSIYTLIVENFLSSFRLTVFSLHQLYIYSLFFCSYSSYYISICSAFVHFFSVQLVLYFHFPLFISIKSLNSLLHRLGLIFMVSYTVLFGLCSIANSCEC